MVSQWHCVIISGTTLQTEQFRVKLSIVTGHKSPIYHHISTQASEDLSQCLITIWMDCHYETIHPYNKYNELLKILPLKNYLVYDP